MTSAIINIIKLMLQLQLIIIAKFSTQFRQQLKSAIAALLK